MSRFKGHEKLTVTAKLLESLPWFACDDVGDYPLPIVLSTNPEANINAALMLVARGAGDRAWWFTRRAGDAMLTYPDDEDYSEVEPEPERDPYVVAQVLAWGVDWYLTGRYR